MTGRPPCELQDAKANRVELLCSRPAVSRPCLASGDIFLSSRVQSHLPCVLRGFSLCPDRVGFVRLATLLAVSHVCQGKVSVHSHIKNKPSWSPSLLTSTLHSEMPAVAPELWSSCCSCQPVLFPRLPGSP